MDWPAAQKAESRASGSGARPPPWLRIGALLPLPLSSSATKFSRPAAQHPLWAGLRRRRQKAEQAGDRGLVPSLSSGLALLSPPLSSSSATKFSRPAAQHPRPFWAGLRRRRQEAGSRPGTTPSFRGVCVWLCVTWFSAAAVSTACFLLRMHCLVHPACNKSARSRSNRSWWQARNAAQAAEIKR